MNEHISGSGGAFHLDNYTDVSAIPASGQILPVFLNDSLSVASSDTSVSSIDASTPILPKVDFQAILMAAEEKKNAIIRSILDEWNKALQEEADRMRDELKSPRYRAWLDSKSPEAIAEREEKNKIQKDNTITPDTTVFVSSLPVEAMFNYNNLQTAYTWNISLSAGINTATSGVSASELGAVAGVGFLGPALLLGSAAIPLFQGIIPSNSSNQNEMAIFKQAWESMNPTETRDIATAVAGWFSALWGIGLIYSQSAQNMQAAEKIGQKAKPLDVDFAKLYATKLVDSLNDPSFSLTLKAMVAAAVQPPDKISVRDLELFEIKGKIVLLSTALALISKLEVGSKTNEGWISEMDFAGLLTGKTDLHINDIYGTADIKDSLITQIKDLIAKVPEKGEDLMYNLLAYMDSNPSVEKLLNQQEVFQNIFAHSADVEGESLNQTPA